MTALLSSRIARLVVLAALAASLLVACAGAAAPAASPAPSFGPAGAPRDLASSPAQRETDGGDPAAPAAPVDDAKIVRTGNLTLRVEEVAVAVSSASAAIDRLGGYVGASRQALDDDRPVAQITYRIPTDRWDDAMGAFRTLGKVLDEQTEAVEVTGQLVDLAARIENLRASEQALQGIASSATRISDVLEVQQRLFQVRGEIEQLRAQQAHLEDQAGFGTLTVTFGVEVVAIAEAAKDWSAATEVENATATLVDLLQGLATAGIWFAIVWLPILIVLVVLGIATLMVLRRLGIVRSGTPSAPSPTATA
jgi:Domain of unknown function (DUF4349)